MKGIILNGGPNRVVDGVEIDVAQEIYDCDIPALLVDHRGDAPWPADPEARRQALKNFVFGLCGAQANWNMDNFIADQVEPGSRITVDCRDGELTVDTKEVLTGEVIDG